MSCHFETPRVNTVEKIESVILLLMSLNQVLQTATSQGNDTPCFKWTQSSYFYQNVKDGP